MEVKRLLMHEARERGICVDGYEEMRNCKNVDELIEYYIKTIDWSLENAFPSLEHIRKWFSPSDLERHGIFVDRTFDCETFSTKQAYVFHNCKGCINVAMDYDNANIPMLYFANGCNIEVYCGQKQPDGTKPIEVPVYIFGENNVTCYDNDNAIFTTYREEVKHE